MNVLKEALDHAAANSCSVVAAYHRLEAERMDTETREAAATDNRIRLIAWGNLISVGNGRVYLLLGNPDKVEDKRFDAVFCSEAVPDTDKFVLIKWASDHA